MGGVKKGNKNVLHVLRGGLETYWVTVYGFAVPVGGRRGDRVPLSSFVKANDCAPFLASRDHPVSNECPKQALNHINIKGGVPERGNVLHVSAYRREANF